jgi:hypothetical protein
MCFKFVVFFPTDTDRIVPISVSRFIWGKNLRHKEHHAVRAGPLVTAVTSAAARQTFRLFHYKS